MAMDKKILDRILTMAVKSGVSDIHFQAGSVPLFRYNGTLMDVKYDVLTPQDTELIAQILLKNDRLHAHDEFVERDVSYGVENAGRFRANIFKQRNSFAIVLRAISIEARTFEQLNLPPTLAHIADLGRGLVLVTGATGNGKSTTMSAMIEHINRTRKLHIITIEDPIEFLYKNDRSIITQREIGQDTRSFPEALHAALRQDPDVILVGEIRDAVTFDTALRAAETGHLVFSAIHTTDAQKTISRVLGFYPPEEQAMARARLADNLAAIISLRLLPMANQQARIPAVEILRMSSAVQECLRNPEKLGDLNFVIARSREYGMMTFDQHLIELCKAGKITPEVARAAATNRIEFDKAMAAERAPTPVAESSPTSPASSASDSSAPKPEAGDSAGKTYSFV
ncbi:MAG: PilT/PilU family type 4a pilus ATPase [Chloracidobacterium sp.]|nr:PilT/PilU family type 4a pilus ATPase [Chloracidobacterium sp.]MDW8216444.1 PilT/PilU family type 4a pilus ATPase [Acidobacteriota bacterium]